MDWETFPIEVPGNDVRIRPATAGDVQGLARHFGTLGTAELQQRFGGSMPPEIDDERIAKTLVAVVGNERVVGEVEYGREPEAPYTMVVRGFSVAWELREFGIGRGLVQGSVSLGRQRFARHFRCGDIARDNEGAMRTLMRAGLHQSGPSSENGIEFEHDAGAFVVGDLSRAISSERRAAPGRHRNCEGVFFHVGLTEAKLAVATDLVSVRGRGRLVIARRTVIAPMSIEDALSAARGFVQVVTVDDEVALDLALQSGLGPEPGRIVLSQHRQIVKRAKASGVDVGMVIPRWRLRAGSPYVARIQTGVENCEPSVVLCDADEHSRQAVTGLAPALLVREPWRTATLTNALKAANVLGVIARRPAKVVAERDQVMMRLLPR